MDIDRARKILEDIKHHKRDFFTLTLPKSEFEDLVRHHIYILDEIRRSLK